MPRDFLLGFIRVPMWDYYWGLTAAQVELLTIDQPVLVYKRDKETTKPGQKGYKGMSAAEGRDLVKNFKKRNILGGSREPEMKRYDMNTFLRTGEKKEI